MSKFWKDKSLAQMSNEEWESLCDNCGKCCLHKLEDEDSGEIFFTSVVCDLIDLNSCRCTHYTNRCKLVPGCIDLKQHNFSEYTWLPATCAYRLLADGKTLPEWHPLLSGTHDTVQDAGVAISSYAMKVSDVYDPEQHIIEWLK